MKHLPLIVLCLIASSIFAADDWPGVKYAEVRAYAWFDRKDHKEEDVILKDMSLKQGVINPDGALLSEEQVKVLLKAVTGVHKDHPIAGCYEPHNAFIFYNSEKKPVAFVEVCFGCLGQRISPEGAAKRIDLPALAGIFGELKLPMGEYADAKAFTESFEKRLKLGEEANEPAKKHAPESPARK